MFVDSDDELMPDGAEKLAASMAETGADIVIGRHIHISISGAERVENDNCPAGLLRGEEFLKAILEDRLIGYSVCRTLYRREAVSCLRFAEGRVTGEDGYFMFQCAVKKPTVAVTDHVVYRYYMNNGSVTHSGITRKKCEDILYLLKLRQDCVAEQFPHLQEICHHLTVKIHMMLLRNFCYVKGKDWRVMERQSLDEVKKYQSFCREITGRDQLFFTVLTHHLYYPYKAMVQLKRKLKG